MTQPTLSVLLPVGQDLGPARDDDPDAEPYYRLFDGLQVHELDAEEYAVWVAACGDLTSGASAWGREETVALALRSGVEDPVPALENLVELGLLADVAIATEDSIRFCVLHEIETRMNLVGPSIEGPGEAAVGIGGTTYTTVSPDAANIYLYGPTYEDLWAACGAVADVSPTEPHSQVPKQLMLAERFLLESYWLLAVGAMSFVRAHRTSEVGA